MFQTITLRTLANFGDRNGYRCGSPTSSTCAEDAILIPRTAAGRSKFYFLLFITPLHAALLLCMPIAVPLTSVLQVTGVAAPCASEGRRSSCLRAAAAAKFPKAAATPFPFSSSARCLNDGSLPQPLDGPTDHCSVSPPHPRAPPRRSRALLSGKRRRLPLPWPSTGVHLCLRRAAMGGLCR
jgi:hypothetical protein